MGLKMENVSTLTKHQKWQGKNAVEESIFFVFKTLHPDILYEPLTALEAEIFQFVRSTLCDFYSLRKICAFENNHTV